MKVILSDNRQKSKCLPLMSLSHFPQEPVLSPEARPCAHLDNCIIIFCIQKGPRMLLSTVKSQDLRNTAALISVLVAQQSRFGAYHPMLTRVT